MTWGIAIFCLMLFVFAHGKKSGSAYRYGNAVPQCASLDPQEVGCNSRPTSQSFMSHTPLVLLIVHAVVVALIVIVCRSRERRVRKASHKRQSA